MITLVRCVLLIILKQQYDIRIKSERTKFGRLNNNIVSVLFRKYHINHLIIYYF